MVASAIWLVRFPSRSGDGIGEREERVVPTNVVKFRVYPCLVYETSRVDLVVVRYVTPCIQFSVST